MPGRPQRETMTDEPWPNRPWLAVMPTRAPSDLAAGGLAPQLPDQLAHLGDGLGGDGLAEAGQPAARVDRDPAPDGGVAVAEQALGLALLAQADVLVPVELEGRGQVVDLGQVEVLGPDAGLLVGGQGDRLLERRARARRRRRAESVAKLGISMTAWGNRGVTVDTASMVTRSSAPAWRGRTPCWYSTRAAPPSEVAQISSRRSGSATIGEARTSSAVTSLRYRAFGFSRPCGRSSP